MIGGSLGDAVSRQAAIALAAALRSANRGHRSQPDHGRLIGCAVARFPELHGCRDGQPPLGPVSCPRSVSPREGTKSPLAPRQQE